MSKTIKSGSKDRGNVPISGYGPTAYTYIIHDHMGKLRARLLNLADSITSDKEQREATKGLIKDFCNDTYYPMLRELEAYLKDRKVLDEQDNNIPGDCPPMLEPIIMQ